MSNIEYKKTKIKGLGRCGMCKNVDFCVNELGITEAISKFCMFKPSQFKPRDRFMHNDDCYFYMGADRYHGCMCRFNAESDFNCLECNKFISHSTAHALIRREVMKRKEFVEEDYKDDKDYEPEE